MYAIRSYYDREIVTRVDDSVARIMDGQVRLLRRGRGYSPVPILLDQRTEDILGCGGEMKNVFCIVVKWYFIEPYIFS